MRTTPTLILVLCLGCIDPFAAGYGSQAPLGSYNPRPTASASNPYIPPTIDCDEVAAGRLCQDRWQYDQACRRKCGVPDPVPEPAPVVETVVDDGPCVYDSLADDVHRDAFGIRRGSYSALIYPTVPSLNIRAAGEGSAIVGRLMQDEEAEVVGQCGNWLEIRRGMLHGWVAGWLICQDDIHLTLGGRDQSRQWVVAEMCQR